jgi:hypothetical protein
MRFGVRSLRLFFGKLYVPACFQDVSDGYFFA